MTSGTRSLAQKLACATVFTAVLFLPCEVEAIEGGSPAPGATSVVFIQFQTSSGKGCTGVVISPGHVLTAAHCVNGGADLFGDTSETVAPGTPISFWNQNSTSTIATSNQTIKLPNFSFGFSSATTESPIHFNSFTASEDDVAVIPLDTRLSVSVAAPVQLPFEFLQNSPFVRYKTSPCPETFNGTYFGFANGSRTQATHEVTRSASPHGNVYRAEFNQSAFFQVLPDVIGNPFEAALGLFGLTSPIFEHGDSGGPLFSGQKLCGVISSHMLRIYPTCDPDIGPIEVCDPITGICIIVQGPGFTCGTGVDNLWARVDTDAADLSVKSFLESVRPRIFDSRGLLFGTCPPGTPAPGDDIDTDGDFLPDGCDPCPQTFDPIYRFTGELTTVLADADGDDVADVCDNCPDVPNLVQGASAYTQPDSDLDGVGDACDSCGTRDDFRCCATDADCGPPSPKCVPLQDSVGVITINVCQQTKKRCAQALDTDGDQIGDLCDDCPHNYDPGQQDTDFDGVGNFCDNCPGIGEFPDDHSSDLNNVASMECDVTADDCASQTQNAESVCVQDPVPGLQGHGHCSKFHDEDSDGLGDACDSCPDAPNPPSYMGGLNGQVNCNLDNEIARGETYPYTGDACDANPCNYLGRNQSLVTDTGSPTTPGDLWVTLSYDPQALPNSAPAKPLQTENNFDKTYTGTPTATVGARFCTCSFNDKFGTVQDCAAQQCPIDVAEYNPGSQFWVTPSLVPTPSTLPASPPASLFPFNNEVSGLTLASPQDLAPLPSDNLAPFNSAPFSVSWDLTRDGTTNQVSYASPGLGTGKLGVFWTAVRNVPQMQQPLSVNVFRGYSNRYDRKFFGKTDDAFALTKQILACPWCETDPCPYCGISADVRNLLVQPVGQRIFAQGLSGTADITFAFSPAAVSSLFVADTRWLMSAERGGWRVPGQIGVAGLSPDGGTLRVALAKVGATVQPLTRAPGMEVPAFSSALASEEPKPGARTEYGAVLSGIEEAVYVIGGRLDPTGELAADIWRFDLAMGGWTRQMFVGPTPRVVLAATYVPETRSLWFVDAGTTKWSLARLMRYDIETNQVKVHGAWLRTGLMDRVELSAAPFGGLLLSGSSSKINHVLGVVLRPNSNSVSVVGAFKQKGTLGLEPTLTVAGLTLPLTIPSGVKNTFAPSEDVMFEVKPKGKGKPKPLHSIASCL